MSEKSSPDGHRMQADETLVLMDLVDTLRAEDEAAEGAARPPELADARFERIRDLYRMQHIEIDRNLVDRAEERLRDEAFAHRPMPSGLGRLAALAYVRRGRVAAAALGLAAAGAAAVYVPPAAYRHFVTAPAERAQAEAAREIDVGIPTRLESALAAARIAAGEDPSALSLLASREQLAKAALARRSAGDARKVVAEIERMGPDLRAAALRGRLGASADRMAGEARRAATSPDARAAVDAAAAALGRAARAGDEAAFSRAADALAETVSDVAAHLTFRVVDRPGVNAGFWREDSRSRARTHYLTVEAEEPGGKVFPWRVRNAETGKESRVPMFAVRVGKEVFDAVGRDYGADKVIDGKPAGSGLENGRVVGRKQPGTLAVDWSSATDGTAITDWN